MELFTLLDAAAAAAATLHLGAPLAYYAVLRSRGRRRGAGFSRDDGYTPNTAVVIPVYNEEGLVEAKLDNVYQQDYPRDRLSIVVVDSASTDSTRERVEEWASRHSDAPLSLIVEAVRRGKIHALNTALKSLDEGVDVVVMTDADSYWPDPATLRRAVSYLADPGVAAVSCLKRPAGSRGPGGVEEGYRGYYNNVRVEESRVWSTPIFHGELAAFRRSFLEEIGGFPSSVGADDSHTATIAALRGYRAIIPGDVWCVELVPERGRGYVSWKARRAQHLVQHFAETLPRLRGAPRGFRWILAAEEYLHLLNPLLMPAALILMAASAAAGSIAGAIMLAAAAAALIVPEYRTWMVSQLLLLYGMARNLRGRNLVWSKEEKRAGRR